MLIAGKSLKEMDVLKKGLHQTFDMKDLGHANHILGMRITRDRNQHLLHLSQEEYIGKVLHRFHMEGGKTISTPLPPHMKLSAKDSPQSDSERAEMAKIPYASACGSLMYAMVATRPDIAFAVGVISRYMANPGKKHWDAVKGIMRYLKGTKEMCICFGKHDAIVHGMGTQTQTMQVIQITGSLLPVMFSLLQVVQFHGYLVYRDALPCLLLRQSMLQLLRLARRPYGLLGLWHIWDSLVMFRSCIVTVRVPSSWHEILFSMQRRSILM